MENAVVVVVVMVVHFPEPWHSQWLLKAMDFLSAIGIDWKTGCFRKLQPLDNPKSSFIESSRNGLHMTQFVPWKLDH